MAGQRQARTLSEAEFSAIEERLIAEAPAGMPEPVFERWIGPRLAAAVAEAEYSPEPSQGSAVERFVSRAGEVLNPITAIQGIASAVMSPVETAKGLYHAQVDQFGKAKTAYDEGRMSEAVGHAGAGMLPILGPMAADAGERAGEGDIAGALGTITGVAAGGPILRAAGRTASAVKQGATRAAQAAKSGNPAVVADAVQWAEGRGIPVDAATATGNPVVRGAQWMADRSIGGAMPGMKAKAARDAALRSEADNLAGRAHPDYVTAEQAGDAAQGGVQQHIRSQAEIADANYGTVRAAERAAMPDDVPVSRPVASGLSVDQGFIGHWLADDLDEIGFQRGGSTKASRDAAYEAADATDDLGKRGMVFNPRVKGTPTIEMFEAAGVGGSRPEIAAKIRAVLSGQSKNPRILGVIDAMGEAWDGAKFDWDLVTDETLTRTGLRRRDFRSPVSMPAIDAPGARKFFGDEAPGLAQSGTEPMQLAVPLAQAKEALRPIYERLMRKKELTGQLMGAEGRAAVALDALVSGPDHAPLSVVDAALGDIKALARGADMPELRNTGQGMAAEAVKQLDALVQARAAEAGPEVLEALKKGRAATMEKWTTAERLKPVLVSAEPVKVFDMLTAGKDSAVERLREVARVAPAEMPKVGRAFLEGLFEKSKAKGGWAREDGVYADWQRMGAETKKVLFPDPALRADLDRFFLLASEMAKNPNPSGSAFTAALTAQGMALTTPAGQASVIGGYALSKALHSPRLVKMLIRGMQTPAKSGTGAVLANNLRQAMKKLGAVPPAAAAGLGQPRTDTPAPIGAGAMQPNPR